MPSLEAYKTELPATMSGLVQIHKIHIDGIPGNIAVELGMEMDKRFLKFPQSPDPHL